MFRKLFNKYTLSNSIISQYSSRIITIIISIIISPILARYLGPIRLGKLSYVIALAYLLIPIVDFGIKDYLPIAISNLRERLTVINTALTLRFIGLIIASIIFLFLSISANDAEIKFLFLISILGFLFQFSDLIEVELLQENKGTKIAKASLIDELLFNSIIVTSIFLEAELLIFGFLNSIKNIVRSFLFLNLKVSKIKFNFLNNYQWEVAKDLLKNGFPLFLSNISLLLLLRIDQVMIQNILGPEQLGQYAVSVRVAESIYFMQIIINRTYLPILIKGSLNFDNDLTLRKFYKITWIVGISLTFFTLFIAPTLLKMIYGKSYFDAVPSLICLAPSAFAISLGSANSLWLKCTNKNWLLTFRSLLSFMLNFILNIFLINKLGIIGAALSTTMAHFFGNFLVNFSYSESTRKNYIKALYPF